MWDKNVPHPFPATWRDTTVTPDLVPIGHIKTSSVTGPSVLSGVADASVSGIMSALARLACLCAVSHEVAYTAVGTLTFSLCLTVRVRIGEPPTAANPRRIDEAPTAFAFSLEIGGNMDAVETPLGKEAASYVGQTASNPLTVTQYT